MEDHKTVIKKLIVFLTDVYNNRSIERQESDFFKMPKDLDELLEKYYISFYNKNDLKNEVEYNYNLIKDMSFPESKEGFFRVKDLSYHSKPNYSEEQYNSYALLVHSYLIRNFEDKLGFKKGIERNKITVKNKKIFKILERVNLEIEFLKYDVTVTDFINVLTEASEKQIHLNIDNRNFHYLLSKMREYFFNFSNTNVAKTNKIFSKSGTKLTPNNLNNSKSDSPVLKIRIDTIFNSGE